jgi:hypothetical protein
MIGGIAAAIIGPQTVILTRDLLSPIPFAGAFFAMSALTVPRPGDRLTLSAWHVSRRRKASRQGGRPLMEIARQPRFIVAVVCGMASYALMSLTMTAAPLAIVSCGLGETNAALGIQWHVLAMFGPSFFTGTLIARYGVDVIVTIGMALLAACGAVALAGVDLANFWMALILLGLGWNWLHRRHHVLTRPTAGGARQGPGLNDFLIFGSVAVARSAPARCSPRLAGAWSTTSSSGFAICVAALAAGIFRRRAGALACSPRALTPAGRHVIPSPVR